MIDVKITDIQLQPAILLEIEKKEINSKLDKLVNAIEEDFLEQGIDDGIE